MKTILSAMVALLLLSSTSFALTKNSRKVSGTVNVTASDELITADNSGGDVNINLVDNSSNQSACTDGRSLTIAVMDNNNVVNLHAASGDGFYNDPSYGSTLSVGGGGTTFDLDCKDGQWYVH